MRVSSNHLFLVRLAFECSDLVEAKKQRRTKKSLRFLDLPIWQKFKPGVRSERATRSKWEDRRAKAFHSSLSNAHEFGCVALRTERLLSTCTFHIRRVRAWQYCREEDRTGKNGAARQRCSWVRNEAVQSFTTVFFSNLFHSTHDRAHQLRSVVQRRRMLRCLGLRNSGTAINYFVVLFCASFFRYSSSLGRS